MNPTDHSLIELAVIVTFAVGAIFFKEKKIKAKAFDLAILLAGMVFLLLGSR